MKTSISKKKNFLPVLIGIIISISPSIVRAEYHAVAEAISDNTGQTSIYAGEVSDNTRVMKNDIHNILSRAETIQNSTTSIAGTSESIRSYLYDICYGRGQENGWFNSMYVLALDMQKKYNTLVSTLDDLYEHISTTQNYQLEDIKNSNQTISDNTTSIKDSAYNIENSTEAIEGYTETIASDTTELKNLFNQQYSRNHYTLNPAGFRPYIPSLDFENPKSITGSAKSYSFVEHILHFLSELSAINSEHTIVDRSSLMNLQAIRTNAVQKLASIERILIQFTNRTSVVKKENLAMQSANNYSQKFNINNNGNYDSLKFEAKGDFYEDIIALSHYQASAAKGRNYSLYSILTNVQIIANTIIGKTPEEIEAEDQVSKSEEQIKETIEAAEEVEGNSGNYIGFKNGISDLQNTASLEALQAGDNMPTEMTFTIPSWVFGDQGGLSEQMVTIDLTKIEPLVHLIRSGFGILYWGLAIFFVVWLWGHFRTLASKFIEFSSGLVSAGG